MHLYLYYVAEVLYIKSYPETGSTHFNLSRHCITHESFNPALKDEDKTVPILFLFHVFLIKLICGYRKRKGNVLYYQN